MTPFIALLALVFGLTELDVIPKIRMLYNSHLRQNQIDSIQFYQKISSKILSKWVKTEFFLEKMA